MNAKVNNQLDSLTLKPITVQRIIGLAKRNKIGIVDSVRMNYPNIARGVHVRKGYEGVIVTFYNWNSSVYELRDSFIEALEAEGMEAHSASDGYAHGIVVKPLNTPFAR